MNQLDDKKLQLPDGRDYPNLKWKRQKSDISHQTTSSSIRMYMWAYITHLDK